MGPVHSGGPRRAQFMTFLLFGGTAAAVNLAVGWALYGTGRFAALPYWCATAIAAACGLVVNFGLNHAFNFKSQARPALQQFGTFCIVSLVGIALTALMADTILSLLLAWRGPVLGFGIRSSLAAHVAAVGLTVLYSYPAHKAVSFNIGIRAQFRLVCAQLAARP